MSSTTFLKWFTEKLLPNLPPNRKCLIIMDNARYHKCLEGIPKMAKMLKAELQKWLEDRGIDFDRKMLKPELQQMVKKSARIAVELLTEEKGHKILWSVPYHPELNPIELCWGISKRHVAATYSQTNSSTEEALMARVFEGFDKCTPDVWRGCCAHVKDFEDAYAAQDLRDDVEFIIELDSEDEEEDNAADAAADQELLENIQEREFGGEIVQDVELEQAVDKIEKLTKKILPKRTRTKPGTLFDGVIWEIED
eukprot:TRINITY_DN14827_c0_g2_i1.p1 TRINITY_DN14827_c0_g2~~TRINITY_DN14827_c0_g2_i1.p1  ORF type:complete len:253 (-),score=65.31 TRINITY_DN14827_c0_g2_i1:11-769(-)